MPLYVLLIIVVALFSIRILLNYLIKCLNKKNFQSTINLIESISVMSDYKPQIEELIEYYKSINNQERVQEMKELLDEINSNITSSQALVDKDVINPQS